MMDFQNLDLFSTQFQFSVGFNQMNKRSKIGALLSMVVIILSLLYFAYLLMLYIENQIDPKYNMQTFLTEESIQIEYHNDIMGFRYEYNINQPIEDLEQKTGLKYLVYVPFLYITTPNDKQAIPLDIIKCQNSNLIGFNCLDLTKVSNYTLQINNKENSQTNIVLLVYRCQDIDVYKQTIPDNCAPEKEIDEIINYQDSQFKLKMFTAQYNTMKEEFEESYKNIYLYIQGDDFVFTRFRTIKQITTVKKGPFIQGKTSFSSPIDYLREERVFNRQKIIEKSGLTFNLQVTLDVAEQYQQVQIQYPSFMEILTICNSTFAVLMGIGVVGRSFAQKLIKQDIQLLLLKNVYQKQYFDSLKKHNMFSCKEINKEVIVKEKKQEELVENTQSIYIPSFLTKSRDAVDLTQTYNNQLTQDCILQGGKWEQTQKQCNCKENDENIKTDEYNSERNKEQITDMTFTKSIEQKDNQINDFQNSIIQDKFSKYKKSVEKNQIHFRVQESGRILIQDSHRDQNDNYSSRFINKSQKYEKKQKQCTNTSTPKQSCTSALTERSQNIIKDEEIQQIDKSIYLEKVNAIQDQSLGTRFQKTFLNVSFYQSIKQFMRKDEDIQIRSELDKQANKHLDILSLFKDVIVLKKAIMMILSKDQLAAIQLIGCNEIVYPTESQSENDENKILSGNGEQKKKLGYLDEQFIIGQSAQKQIDYTNKFLSRIKNNKNISLIDQRIYSSLQ